jgi:hypothetical protein
MMHDQNFKNLILDYPHQAIALFAASEAQAIDADARVTPVRQEQLQERLGERFRELDVPLLVQWPDGRREAILFVIEEETEPARFSVHRLAHYCLDLSELLHTRRVVPVVVFLHVGLCPRAISGRGCGHELSRLPLPRLCAPADSGPGALRQLQPGGTTEPAEHGLRSPGQARGLCAGDARPDHAWSRIRSAGSSTWISSTSMRRWTRMNASSIASGIPRRWQR